MAWQYFYGAYDNTGPYANVVLGGSPDNTGPFGAPLATAHASGYGKGINFTDNGVCGGVEPEVAGGDFGAVS